MAAEDQSVFQEVLSLQIDTDGFAADLQSIEDMWNASLQRMADAAKSAGIDPSELIPTAAVQDQFTELGAQIESVAQDIQNSFSAMSKSVTDELASLDAAVTKTKGGIEDLNAAGSEDDDDESTISAASERVNTLFERINAGKKNQGNIGGLSYQEQADAFNRFQDMLGEEGEGAFDKLTAANLKWYEGYAATMAKAEMSAKEFADAEVEDIAAAHEKALVEDEEWARKRVALIEQAEQQMSRALGASEPEAIAAAHDKALLEDEVWTRKRVALVEQAEQQMARAIGTMEPEAVAAAHEKALLEDEAWTRKRVGLIEQAQKEMDRSLSPDAPGGFGKRGAKRQTLFGVDLDEGVLGNFASGLTMGGQGVEGIAAMAGYMTSMATIGAALFTVIDGIKEALGAIPRLLAEGVDYLSQMQEKAAEMAPVIQRVSNFGPDMQTGMGQALQVAGAAIDALKQKSVELNLPFDQLIFTFKSLAANGAGGLVHDWQDMVDIAVRLNEAIKMTVPDMAQQRDIMRELPQLMDGTATNQNKILAALGMTVDQWNAAVQRATSARDLVDVINEHTQQWSEGNKTIATTYDNLKEQLGRIVDLVAASAAKPLFDDLQAAALKLLGYYNEHKAAINSIAESVGVVVERVLDFISALVHAGASLLGIHDVTNSVANVFNGIVFYTSETFSFLTMILRAVTALSQIDITHPFSSLKDKMKEVWDAFKKDASQDIKPFVESVSATAGIAAAQKPGLLETPTNGGFPGFDGKSENKNWKAVEDQIKSLEAAQDDLRSHTKEAMQDRSVSVAEGSKEIIASYGREKSKAIELIEQYKRKVNKDDIKPDDRQQLLSAANAKEQELIAKYDRGIASARGQSARGQLEEMKQFFSQSLEDHKSNYEAILEQQKQAETEGTETVSQATKNRIDIRQTEVDEMRKVVQAMREQFGHVPGAAKVFAGFDETLDKLQAGNQKQDSTDKLAAVRDEQQIEINKYQTLEKLAEDHFRTMSEMTKRAAQEGLMSHAEAAGREIDQQKELYETLRSLKTEEFETAHPGVDHNSRMYQAFQSQLQLMDQQQSDQRSQDNFTLDTAHLQDLERDHNRQLSPINAQIQYAQAITDGAEKQDKLNELLSQRLAADQAYLEALVTAKEEFGNRAITGEDIQKARNEVSTSTLASIQQYNSQHAFSEEAPVTDSSGNVTGQKGAGFLADLQKSSQALNQVFGMLEQTTNELINAQGNLWKKMGAAASGGGNIISQMGDSGSLSSIGNALGMASAAGPIGAAIGVAGGLFSAIGSMFTAQAKNIANDVQKAFDQILQNYQNQTATFNQTMQALNTEREQAIQQLSGVKGGQQYLSQILLQVDQTMASLQAQAEQASQQFMIQTATLQQSTQIGQSWLQTWASIEEQVKQYLNQEGGNPAEAAIFQNSELATQAQQINDQYNQGMEQAIQDNYTLNNLYLSRQQIQLSILQLQEQTGDSIERQEAPALGLAAQQQKLELEQLQQQLSDTNNQINIEQNKVTAENQVFGLTTNINQLHAEDAALQQQALTEQLANYQQMYQIIKAIAGLKADPTTGYFPGYQGFGAAGLPGGIPGFGATSAGTGERSPGAPVQPVANPISSTHNNIIVQVPPTMPDPKKYGTTVGTAILQTLAEQRRYGISVS